MMPQPRTLLRNNVREALCGISSARVRNTGKKPTVGAQWGMYWGRNCNTRREDDIPLHHTSGKAGDHPAASSGGRPHVPSPT
jgi:hypothetical protein